MAGRVEVKARARDWALLAGRAERLSGSPARLETHHDTFFAAPRGRLKLRRRSRHPDGLAQLIFYERPEAEGPQLCRCAVSPTEDPAGLTVVLEEQQSPQEGALVAQQLMAELGVDPEDLLPGAYLDLLGEEASQP